MLSDPRPPAVNTLSTGPRPLTTDPQALTPSWPSSRVLAGWWPSLGRWRPHAVWLHHLLLHRVEAPVLVAQAPALDRLHRLLLEAVSRLSAPRTASALAQSLTLEPALVRRVLADAAAAGLAEDDGGWALTAAGEAALAAGDGVPLARERRVFYFAEGGPAHPGQRFLKLDQPAAAVTAPEGWRFDPQALAEAVARPDEWKGRRGFPADVRGLATAAGAEWERVVVDRAEQALLLCVLTDGGEVLGFAAAPGTFQASVERPTLRLAAPWDDALPELASEPDGEAWRAAWRGWGQPRGLPAGELEACRLEASGVLLRVGAPPPLVERLRETRSDALKGEAWVLAGTGERTRRAARLELVAEAGA